MSQGIIKSVTPQMVGGIHKSWINKFNGNRNYEEVKMKSIMLGGLSAQYFQRVFYRLMKASYYLVKGSQVDSFRFGNLFLISQKKNTMSATMTTYSGCRRICRHIPKKKAFRFWKALILYER